MGVMEPAATPTRDQISARIQDALVGQILNHEFSIEVDPQDFEDVTTLGQAQDAMLKQLK
jgi:hypothetical protein